jgi:hypothetical protein
MKVRLTADGIQEVMDALKKVQTGVKKTGDAAKGATDALGSLGTLFAAQKLASFAGNALEAADNLFKMGQKTGVSVEQLSVFSYMAAQADVSSESLTKGFGKLAKSLDALNSGDATTTDAFKRIGLDAAELKGLSLDQVLLKVANAQSRFADGAGKTAVMMQIFGKSGAELIPLMNDLANGGFENAKAKLQELGLVISTDMAKNAQDFNDSMKRVEMAAQGVVTQVAQGALPALTSAGDALTAVLADMPAFAKTFSVSFAAIGTVATAAAVGVRTLGTAIMGLGGVGIAVVAISAAVSGVMALQAAEEEEQKTYLQGIENKGSLIKTGEALEAAYRREAEALRKAGNSKAEIETHSKKLKEIEAALIAISPELQQTLQDETLGLNAKADAIRRVRKESETELKERRAQAVQELAKVEGRWAQTYKGVAEDNPALAGTEESKPELTKLAARWQNRKDRFAFRTEYTIAAIDRLRTEINKIDIALGTIPDPKAKAPETKTKKPKVSEKTNAAAGKALAAELAAEAKRELESRKQEIEEYSQLTEALYKDGLIDLGTYLAARKTAIEAGTAAEVKALEAQIAAEQGAKAKLKTPDEKMAAQTKLADLQAQLDRKKQEGVLKLEALEREGDDKRRAGAQEALKLEAELEASKGRTGAAAIAAIQAEYAERIRTAKTPEAKAALEGLRDNAISHKNLEGVQRTGDVAQKRLDNALGQIDLQQQAGTISSTEAVDKQIAAYEEWIAVMQQAAVAQKAIAEGTGDESLVADADAQILKISGLRQKLAELKDPLLELKRVGKDAIEDGLTDFLVSLGDTTTSVADKFRALGAAIAQAMAREAASQLAKTAVSAMGSAFGFASGGYTGDGARLEPAGLVHRGEYVFSQPSVRALGVDTLERLHRAAKGGVLAGLSVPKGLLPGYADGGLVGAAGPAALPVTLDSRSRMEIGLDEGLILRALDSPEGAKVVVKHLSRHSKSANRALGRS